MRTDEPIAQANTAQWQGIRISGIGASEAAEACGLSGFGTALKVWANKTEEGGGGPRRMPLVAQLGHMMEPIIRFLFEKATGVTVKRSPLGLYRSRRFPWLIASPDAHVWSEFDGDNVADWKFTTYTDGLGLNGTDAVRDEWMVQLHVQMEVMECDVAYCCAFIGGRDLFRWFRVERNEELMEWIIRRTGELWDMIQARKAPAPDWAHETTLPTIKRINRDFTENRRCVLSAEDQSHRDRWLQAAEEIAKWQAVKDEMEARLRWAVGDSQIGVFPDTTGVKLIHVRGGEGRSGHTRLIPVDLSKGKRR